MFIHDEKRSGSRADSAHGNDDSQLLVRVAEGVAHITLDRPPANAIDLDLAKSLMRALHRCEDDASVRAVLLDGQGRLFCAGGDLSSFHGKQERAGAYVRELLLYLHEAIATIVRLNAPVIAVVHGSAAGAGFALACACDIIVAAASAKFLMAYTKAGLTPDGASTWILPRMVGLHRALDLTLANRVLSAGEAREWGIVSQVVPDELLGSTAFTLARECARGAPYAAGTAKRLLRNSFEQTLHTQMALEAAAVSQSVVSEHGREGMSAFLEKRPPRFQD